MKFAPAGSARPGGIGLCFAPFAAAAARTKGETDEIPAYSNDRGAMLVGSLGSGLAADPMGTWHTEEGKATVRIAACGPALCGTIISLKAANDPDTGKPQLDNHNVDASLRSRPMVGVLVVLGMKPSGTANKWSGRSTTPRTARPIREA